MRPHSSHLIQTSHIHCTTFNRKSQILNKWLAALQPVLPHWKRMQCPSPVDPARQDLGIFSDIVMAPQPVGLSGPMAQGHLMTIEIQDEDLIRSQAPKMNKHEVPSYYGSLANNTTKGLRSGSIIFGKNPICQHTTNLSDFIAKQVLCRSGLYLKHEPNVKTLLLDIKMLVSPMHLTVPSAVPIQLSLSANPNQLKTERLENNLRLCGENWLTNSNFSSLMEMTKVHSSSQRPTLAHMSSTLKIEETELGNQCSNLPLLEVDSCLPLFHLICLFLVSLLKCCNGFSLKPTKPMCDGRLFACSPFCRLACRGARFRGFPFRWVLHFALSLTRNVIVHDPASCSREDSLYECDPTCEALSCLFFTALWLQSNQSILVQETQSAKDIDLTCFKTFPMQAATCLQVGPMSLDWPVDPFARFDYSRSSLSPEVPSDEQQRGVLPASTRSRWRQNALQAPPQVLQRTTGWDGCGPFLSRGLRCITWNTRVSLDLFSPNRRTESSNSNISRSSLTPTTSYVSRRCMERTSISRLFRCWLRELCFFGTFTPENEDAGGSAICIHSDVACHGRDHLVNIQSGRHNLVIVNVHFEPELTLRQLRRRLHLIHPHWPSYPNGVGLILVDFNTCDPEEGRFNVWNQTFTDGDPRKTAMFHSFFHTSLRLLNLITREWTPQSLGFKD